jgi:hypothetical protein
MISEITIGLFFLYFVLMCGASYSLLNCSLQRFLKESIFIKHFIILSSIFLFTFVLCWYSFSPLHNRIENYENIDEESINKKKKYVKKSIYLSFLIYLLFILTTKNSDIFMLIFLVSITLIVFAIVYLKILHPKIFDVLIDHHYISDELKDSVIQQFQNEKINAENMIFYFRILLTFVYSLILLLLVGAYQYYLKQYADHKKNWSWITFWFGHNKKCQGVD